MTVKHVIFDFDGTLVDSLGVMASAYNRIAAQRGFRPMNSATIAELRTLGPRERLRYLNVRWYHMPGLASAMKRAWRDQLPRLKLFPGVSDLVTTLHQRGLGVGVVSSNAADNIRAYASQVGLPAFTDVRSSGMFSKHVVLGKYLRRHGLLREQALYVGDEVRDAEACRQVGVSMIAVTWGADQRESFAKYSPVAFADSPAHLADLI